MKKLLAFIFTLALLVTGLTVAYSAKKGASDQSTLAAYAAQETAVNALQRQQVRAAIASNPGADRFICTGIRLESQPMSINILVRQRAKAACEFAKELNPSLSTWYQTKPTQAKSYSGKVLLTIKTPDQSAVANKTSVNADICKLQENSRTRGDAPIYGDGYSNATAFPFSPSALPITGEINVSLIYLDWADSPGTESDFSYFKKQLKMFEDFYAMASEQKLKMNVTTSDQWFRMAGSHKDFIMTQQDEAQNGAAPKKQVFYDAAIAASDPGTDYSGVDIVFFAIPRQKSVFLHGGPHEFNWNFNGYLKTAEGNIYDTASAGDWFLKNGEIEPPWVYYVHEVGHMIGIPHQANEDYKDGRVIHLNNPISGYEIMANQGGASRTMSAWLRWLAGWLADEQVMCVTKDIIEDELYELGHLNAVEGKVEALVIKLSDTKAVVVESRRFDPYFDRVSPNSKDGLLIYQVDATKASAQGSQAIISPRDITKYIEEPSWRSYQELDAMFFQGDSVEIEGLLIQAYSIGKGSDIVRVKKLKD